MIPSSHLKHYWAVVRRHPGSEEPMRRKSMYIWWRSPISLCKKTQDHGNCKCIRCSTGRHSHSNTSTLLHNIQKRKHNRDSVQLPKSEPVDHNSLCSTLTHCNPSNPYYIAPSVSLDGPLWVMELRMVAIDRARVLVAFDYDTDCVCDVSSRNSPESTNTILNIITLTSFDVDLICRHLHVHPTLNFVHRKVRPFINR
jgi:hypothetical protein